MPALPLSSKGAGNYRLINKEHTAAQGEAFGCMFLKLAAPVKRSRHWFAGIHLNSIKLNLLTGRLDPRSLVNVQPSPRSILYTMTLLVLTLRHTRANAAPLSAAPDDSADGAGATRRHAPARDRTTPARAAASASRGRPTDRPPGAERPAQQAPPGTQVTPQNPCQPSRRRFRRRRPARLQQRRPRPVNQFLQPGRRRRRPRVRCCPSRISRRCSRDQCRRCHRSCASG